MKTLCLAFGVLFSVVSFSQENRVKQLYFEINNHDGNLPLKISLYSQILASDSADYEAILGLGRTYLGRSYTSNQKHDIYLDSAQFFINKACASPKADYQAFNSRANLYHENNALDYALTDYSRVIQMNPNLKEEMFMQH